MRLDKYLKVSRIIKRRTVAKEAGEGGRVSINGQDGQAVCRSEGRRRHRNPLRRKAGAAPRASVAETVRKNEASAMYEMLEGEEME